MAKRIMCIIISVLMIVSLLPTGVFADSGDDTGGIVEVTTSTTDADSGETTDEDQASPESDGEEENGEETPAEEADSNDGISVASEDGEPSTSYVAKIGETEYTTLADAISNATTGATVTVTGTVDESSTAITITGKSITLDLNGQSVSVSYIAAYAGATLTITDNTSSVSVSTDGNYTVSYSGGCLAGYAVYAENGGTVILASGKVTGTYGLRAFGDTTGETEVKSTVQVKGGYIYATECAVTAQGKGATAIIDGGVMETADNAVVAGNGLNTNETKNGGTYITINGGYLIGHIQTSGYVACGIYHPQSGTLTITGGTIYVDGGCGILMRGGKLTMTGGTIIATGDSTTTGKVGDSRVVVSDSGIVYDYDSGYYDVTNVSVSLSDSVSVTAAASAISVVDEYSAASSTAVTVSGGTYLTTSNGTAVADTSVNAYVADGMTVNENGAVVTDATTYVAQIGDEKYTTLGDAIAAVPVGTSATDLGAATTITILCDIDNAEGISVPSYVNLTIDFAGHTYILTGPGAGSTGTETQGFQLLKDSTIVMKNGTIKIAKGANNIKRIIQSYANVTLTDMIFYSENQVGGEDYCLSFNNGTVNITGKTSIYSGNNDTSVTAFDVYYWSAYSGTTVTFADDYEGTIDGYILYDTTDSTKATLTINGNGTFNGGVVLSSDAEEAAATTASQITISGGTFGNDVSEYCTDGYAAVYNSTTGKYTVDDGVAAVYDADDNCVAVYETLAGAVAAVESSQTIKLIANTSENVIVSTPLTLDLNGYTLSGSSTGSPVIKATESASLTITDSSTAGTGTVSGYSGSGVIQVSSGSLTIDSGSYVMNGGTSGAIIRVESSSDNSLAISGGTFGTSSSTSNSYAVQASGLGTISISGGSFYATSVVLKCIKTSDATLAADIDVTGGCFYGTFSENYSDANTDGHVSIHVSGGYFSVNDAALQSYLAVGYGLTKVDDEESSYNEMWEVSTSAFVVENSSGVIVGSYSSISNAMAAISSNSWTDNYTIVMYADSTDKLTVQNGYSLTLDLNGYSLTNSSAPAIAVHGSLTINDSSEDGTGKVTANTSDSAGVVRNFGGTLVINGGTYSSSNTSATAVIINTGKCSDSSCSDGDKTTASTTINGGVFNGSYTTGTYSGTLAITDGTFTATVAVALTSAQDSNYGSVEISGGYFSSSTIWAKYSTSDTLTISGGYFTSAPSSTYVAEGYGVFGTTDSTYLYTVAQGTAVASIGTTQYLTLSEAVAVANSATEATTITLLQSVALDSALIIGNTSYAVTLDLNDCAITRGNTKSNYLIGVASNASLVIKDSGTNGKIDSPLFTVDETNYAGYAVLTNGSLTVESGTLNGYYGVYVSGSSARLTVNGGAVTGYYGVRVNGGSLTVDGGTVSGTAYGVYQVSGSTTVSSGSVTGASRGISASAGTVTVSGGTVSATSTSSYSYGIVQFAGTLNITGGTISGASAYGIQATGTVTIDGSDVSISGPYAGVFFTGSSTTATIKSGTITGTSVGIGVANGATVTVGTAGSESTSDPVITASGSSSHGAEVAGGSSLTINSGKVTGSSCGIFVGEGESDNYTTLTITGGEIKSDSIGVSTNGSQNYTKIVMSGGSIDAAYGMYLPAMNSTTEISGGTITGTATGIEIRAGSLTVSGGTISGSTSEFAYTFNGSGTTVIGAGIAISQHSTNQSVTVTITGGEISGSYGVFEVNTYSTSTSDVKLSISGDSTKVSGTTEAVYSVSLSGDVEGLAEGVTTYASEATTVAISGGSFSTIVDEDYCAEGYVPVTTKNDSDYYAVTTGDTVASITSGEVTTDYITLKKALTAAEDGDTITLEANIEVYADLAASTEGTVTIDLNGKKLTINTGVTLTVASGTTVVIKDSSSAGLVTNNGTISVAGTLDIRDLGYTTETSGAGLLGQQSGQIALASTGTFIVPDAWETYWSSYGAWDPTWSTAAHIFSTVEKGATVYSYGKGWTCTEGFTGTSGYTSSGSNYWTVSGTYLVEYFKTSRGSTDDHTISATESDTWTYPAAVTDNMIFAGWYTDDTCATVYSATSGVAYAKFVTLIGEDGSAAGVINFLGAGLSTEYNDDTSSYSEISIRFGYDIVIPDDCGTDDSYSWLWQWSTGTSTNYKTKVGSATTSLYGKSYTSYVGTTTQFRSNLVISKIPSTSYDTDINSILSVTYKTADGTTVTATDEIRTRNVNEIVSKIEENSDANSTEKAIAAGIKALSTGSSEG